MWNRGQKLFVKWKKSSDQHVGGKKWKKPVNPWKVKYMFNTYLEYGKILFRGKIVWATYLHDLLVRCFCCFLLLTGFVCLVHISDVIFDANQSREYKCSLFSSEISRSCLHWRHHLLFPFLASPNLCGSRRSSIDSFLDYNFMLQIQILFFPTKTFYVQ